jgi:hypothetical protein
MRQTKTAASNSHESSAPGEARGTSRSVFEQLVEAPVMRGNGGEEAGSGVLLGTCVDPPNAQHPGTCTVRLQKANGDQPELQVPYLETVSPQKDQLVLLLWPGDSDFPIVIGGLAQAAGVRKWALSTGQTVILDEKSAAAEGPKLRICLRDGRVPLEIDLGQECPTVRVLHDDVVLDFEGGLKITARTIDLVSTRGNINVTANDDFKVAAERIRLN